MAIKSGVQFSECVCSTASSVAATHSVGVEPCIRSTRDATSACIAAAPPRVLAVAVDADGIVVAADAVPSLGALGGN